MLQPRKRDRKCAKNRHKLTLAHSKPESFKGAGFWHTFDVFPGAEIFKRAGFRHHFWPTLYSEIPETGTYWRFRVKTAQNKWLRVEVSWPLSNGKPENFHLFSNYDRGQTSRGPYPVFISFILNKTSIFHSLFFVLSPLIISPPWVLYCTTSSKKFLVALE